MNSGKARKIIILTLGWVFLIVGILGLVLPFIQGILCMVIGFYLLSKESAYINKLLHKVSLKIKQLFPGFHAKATAVKEKAQRFADNLFKFRSFLFAVLIISFTAAAHSAQEFEHGNMGITFGYPSVGFRYFQSDTMAIEPRVQSDQGLMVAGFRGYRYFYGYSADNVFLISGFDMEYIQYDSPDSTGTGYMGAFFMGIEYFFSDKFALQLDTGPGYLRLQDKDVNVFDETMFFSVNAGLNWYFR
ncbi:MAG: hypothetical protein A2252_04030 [Elusimicrobia bacterium RIFOXYA2_FULL_39_19]|nr:MAG: hypothetical protein A2252_04030 [Elusimicrobia bacterium RIFOXYA2_FULL_39_19]